MQNGSKVPLNQSLQSNQSSKRYPPQQFNDHSRQFLQRLNGYSPQAKRQNLAPYLRVLQEELQSTTINYQNMLQAQKRSSAERSEFLLNLVQSLRLKHTEEIQGYKTQLQQMEAQQQQAEKVEDQMKNIGEGIDSIVQQSKNLQIKNESLQKQLKEQQEKEKILDQEINEYQKEIEECKGKIDEWEKINLKWNRQKKQIQNILEEAEQLIKPVIRQSYRSNVSENAMKQQFEKIQRNSKRQVQENFGNSVCPVSGFDEGNCEHCQKSKLQQLFKRYNVIDN